MPDELSRKVGLPLFPCAFFIDPEGMSPGQLWLNFLEAKHKAALDVVRSGKPLIWTDDVAITELRQLDPEGYTELTDAGALLIEPNPSRGLRPEHFDQIEAFINDALTRA